MLSSLACCTSKGQIFFLFNSDLRLAVSHFAEGNVLCSSRVKAITFSNFLSWVSKLLFPNPVFINSGVRWLYSPPTLSISSRVKAGKALGRKTGCIIRGLWGGINLKGVDRHGKVWYFGCYQGVMIHNGVK